MNGLCSRPVFGSLGSAGPFLLRLSSQRAHCRWRGLWLEAWGSTRQRRQGRRPTLAERAGSQTRVAGDQGAGWLSLRRFLLGLQLEGGRVMCLCCVTLGSAPLSPVSAGRILAHRALCGREEPADRRVGATPCPPLTGSGPGRPELRARRCPQKQTDQRQRLGESRLFHFQD